jgi:hypothetical protein
LGTTRASAFSFCVQRQLLLQVRASPVVGELQPLLLGTDCPWLLVAPETIERLHTIISLDQWRFAGTLRRPSSPSDDLLLYEKIAPR